MRHNELLRGYRPESYHEHAQRGLLLADPLSFREEFDGVLLRLGRWPYERVAKRFDVLANRHLRRLAGLLRGKQSASDLAETRFQLQAMFKQAGWTEEEFNAEVHNRILTKLA